MKAPDKSSDSYLNQFYGQTSAPGNKEADTGKQENTQQGAGTTHSQSASLNFPTVQLPKGGGAIKGIGEKFQANPVTGTGSFSIPLPITPGRGGFSPMLSLNYDSGSGNSPFGLGWGIGVPSIVRKTDKGLPRYNDEQESDVFILAGAEDLVPLVDSNGQRVEPDERSIGNTYYRVYQYRPRTEGLFARVERWQNTQNRISHWRIMTKDNVTSIYGYNESTRIFFPGQSRKVYQWMLESSIDSKGNLIRYEYKQENGENIEDSLFEHHRLTLENAFTNLYLKKVNYGNTTIVSDAYATYTGNWCFSLVFDYGEHVVNGVYHYSGQQNWSCRSDAFSSYRSGFEIRTWRLCQNVIMFHNFSELAQNPVPIKVLALGYDSSFPGMTLLRSVTLKGFSDAQEPDTFPPVTFLYSQSEIATQIQEVDPEDLVNYSGEGNYKWVDLYGEGLSGLLLQNPNAWYYKENLGDKSQYDSQVGDGSGLWFSGTRQLPRIPSESSVGVQLSDLDGNGKTDVVVKTPGVHGYHELNDQGEWEPFRAFKNIPNINFEDPNLRMLDLTGDGHADILITENDCYTAYYSQAKLGYGVAQRLSKSLDEETGPRLVFSDVNQQIFIADMSGDGLSDIVRIRNGSVDYWPNLGYGKFGHKVKMLNAPHYDMPGQLDGSRIRLADVDGTGTTDIIFLGTNKIQYWQNLSGNAWGDSILIDHFPGYEANSDFSVMDLMGNGTSCLVRIRKPSYGRAIKLQYLELTGGKKPFLLQTMNNNMGAVTSLSYKPSTYFYLTDKLNGKPWVARLPFPVHVVEKVTIEDEPSGTQYGISYKYHHGYFDGVEREFRGFGMVEQKDSIELGITPNPNEESQAPVLTKTWFHTGFYMEQGAISQQYIGEYYQDDSQAWLLPDTILPEDLEVNEVREACRALRGSVLRQEIYGLDGSSLESRPYTVSERSYTIRKLQSKGVNPHAVFQVVDAESIMYYYERNPQDPRIQHTLVQETDDLGNILKQATVAYPRRENEFNTVEQEKLLIKYDEAQYINVLNNSSFYRHSVPCAQRSYQIHNFTLNGKVTVEQLQDDLDEIFEPNSGKVLTNHTIPGSNLCARLLSHKKQFYSDNGGASTLQFGQISFHGLIDHEESLAFSYDCLDVLLGYNNDENEDPINPLLPSKANFASLLSAQQYSTWGQTLNQIWKPSSQMVYDTNGFFQPAFLIDPFYNGTQLLFDNYYLLPIEIDDALFNVTSVVNDYRMMQPKEITDPNGSKTMVMFDGLGMVTRMAVGDGDALGDTIEEPTVQYEYDLNSWLPDQAKVPVHVHVKARKRHQEEGWLESYTYSDGLGREVQTKVQAEDGLAWKIVDNTPVQENSSHRWVATGRKIYNNKGAIIKQYEPWFSNTSDYESEAELTQYGVTPVMHYDAAGRLIRTDFPDGTYNKVEFDAWYQLNFDRNDCVEDSQWAVTMQNGTDEEQRALTLTLEHADTPQRIDLDTLGRPYRITDDAGGEDNKFVTVNHLDLLGLTVMVTDAKGRDMTTHFYDMTGQLCYTFNIDSGHRWMMNNVLDLPVHIWDNLQNHIFQQYDELLRPTALMLYESGATTSKKVEEVVYGTDPIGFTIGRPVEIYDQSGKTILSEYDFKGNILSTSKLLCQSYNSNINWLSNPLPTVNGTYDTSFGFDAMNRLISETTPDGKTKTLSYNKAGLLEQILIDEQEYISGIDYNEKGQRLGILFGNSTKTFYEYYPETFRLKKLRTTKNNGSDYLQDILYIYDPEGNIVQQADSAQQTYYFSNSVVSPTGKYEYDALYRIIKAEGRELKHLGKATDTDFVNNLPVPNAGANVLETYMQLFSYDELGNMLSLQSQNHWTRDYVYATGTNRLLKHDSNQTQDDYTYDAHGNMVTMPHLSEMKWDYKNRLVKTVQGSVVSYYRYDSSGNRVRKITEKTGGIKEERIYVGNYEYFSKITSGFINVERHTLCVTDDSRKIALIETKTSENNNELLEPEVLIRYQYDNHLGSASLELDDSANIISYEEYHPFGTTSYRSGRTETEVSLKRYKYVGKERDEETGLYYYGARYYAGWLCRFVSVDPLQFKYPELTPFQYASNRPVSFIDLDGLEAAMVVIPNGMSQKDKDDMFKALTYQTPETEMMASIAFDLSPFGTIKGLIEGVYGKDIITGENLAGWQRSLSLIPAIGVTKEVTNSTKILKVAEETKLLNSILQKGFIKDANGLFNASAYRRNLQVYTKMLGKGMDAHHIFPQTEKFASFFERMGIEVNNPAFMKWIKHEEHIGKFSTEYNRLWSNFIKSNSQSTFTTEQLIEKAKLFEEQALKTAQEFKKVK